MLLLFAIHAKRRRSLSASASRSRSFSDSGFHFAEISQRSSNYLPAKPTTPLPLWDYSNLQGPICRDRMIVEQSSSICRSFSRISRFLKSTRQNDSKQAHLTVFRPSNAATFRHSRQTRTTSLRLFLPFTPFRDSDFHFAEVS